MIVHSAKSSVALLTFKPFREENNKSSNSSRGHLSSYGEVQSAHH